MKTKWLLSCLLVSVMVLCSCSSEAKKANELEQIRSVCNLATLEVHYNNVAKSVKKAGEGFVHLGEVDREFWIEYQGVAKIGIDMDKLEISTKGEKVQIKIPEATLLSINIDQESLNAKSYIYSEDAFFNKNPVNEEDQKSAISTAQKKMEETVMADKKLFQKAGERAKRLLEEYVKELGKTTGKAYQVELKN